MVSVKAAYNSFILAGLTFGLCSIFDFGSNAYHNYQKFAQKEKNTIEQRLDYIENEISGGLDLAFTGLSLCIARAIRKKNLADFV